MHADTIAAIASPPGSGARGVLRVSGPAAFPAVALLCGVALPRARGVCDVAVPVRGTLVDGFLVAMPGPGSYTGEDVVEMHLPGSPLLLDEVLADLRTAGVRAATPGEFTRRAFEHGRLRLEQAEAVADLIAADGEDARRLALHALAGGLDRAVATARAAVQDALALLEAGLDFADGDTGEVAAATWLEPLARAEDLLAATCAELPEAVRGGEIILLGAANAGKSSLCNALLGRDAQIVDASAGTTRDVVAVALGNGVTLLDAPGDLDAPDDVDRAAIALRDQQAARAAGALLVVDLAAPCLPALASPPPIVATVFTKTDLLPPTAAETAALLAARGLAHLPRPHWFVSSLRGEGVSELREFLRGTGAAGPTSGRSRWRGALSLALVALGRARTAGHEGGLDEIVAADLVEALRALDSIHGRSSPEDVLDRVFARFCLGK